MPRVVPIHWISPKEGFAACHDIELSRVPCVGELIVFERSKHKDCDDTCPQGLYEVLALRHTPGATNENIDADIYIAKRDMSSVLEPLEAWLASGRKPVRRISG